MGGVIHQTVGSRSENNATIPRAGKKADTIRGESASTFRPLMLLIYRSAFPQQIAETMIVTASETVFLSGGRISSVRYYSDFSSRDKVKLINEINPAKYKLAGLKFRLCVDPTDSVELEFSNNSR